MIMHDLNQTEEKVMLLIHPMMSSGDGLRQCITDFIGAGYRYLLPDLAGHGEAVNQTYESAEKEAEQIHDYLKEHEINHIQLAYCASLGGCVLFQMLRYKDIQYSHLFFEGVSFYEKTDLLFFLSKKMFLKKHRQAVKNHALSVQRLTKLYGEQAGAAMSEQFIGINENSIVNICRDCSYMYLPELDRSVQERCIIAYGSKDFDLRNTKRVLPRKYPFATLKVWNGRGHCERISKDSMNYAKMLKELLDDEPVNE